MSSRYRLLATAALLVVATAPTARAQTPESRPRAAPGRVLRFPAGRFEYHLPRMTLRPELRMRLDAGELRLRALERSFDRMDRVRERQFALRDRMRERQLAQRDRAQRQQLEVRERAMPRMRERMERFPALRPFIFRRRSRTI